MVTPRSSQRRGGRRPPIGPSVRAGEPGRWRRIRSSSRCGRTRRGATSCAAPTVCGPMPTPGCGGPTGGRRRCTPTPSPSTRRRPEFDVLGRIHDAPGASVKDSFATLISHPTGTGCSSTRRGSHGRPARSPTAPATRSSASPTSSRSERGGTPGVVRTTSCSPACSAPAAVTILGARTPDERYDRGGILHRTSIGGTPVVGLSNMFGAVDRRRGSRGHGARTRRAGSSATSREPRSSPRSAARLRPRAAPLRVWVRDLTLTGVVSRRRRRAARAPECP